ncbi:hypothetical protein NQZ79_g6264 [Umbelopsis isabellina]|nr:hypothetical protein NQZ79_g6264 [Umbelopsis isabellina]
MILFFQLHQPCKDDEFRYVMTNLQELASASVWQGLVYAAKRRMRLRWEDNLTTQKKFPTFLSTEVQGLTAPANNLMWQAATRYDWKESTTFTLAEWMDSSFTIDELWPTLADMKGINIVRNMQEWIAGWRILLHTGLCSMRLRNVHTANEDMTITVALQSQI